MRKVDVNFENSKAARGDENNSDNSVYSSIESRQTANHSWYFLTDTDIEIKIEPVWTK